jgi:N-acetyl-beta-hexosaminidase
MEIVIGLLIIAIGAFCQSSCYVPINKIKDWSWESYWIVQGVFPSRLIHIGGDECPKVRWKNCPKCQAKIRELQLKDDGKHSLENQLQSYINHEEEQQYILCPQVNLWTEYIAAPEHLFYMLLPRLDAISEVQWCQPGQKNFDDFKRRLPRMMQLYDRLAVSYCRKVE